MLKNSLGYLIREGFRNIRANRQMSAASVGVLIACMVLIGGAVMLSLNINALMGYVESFNEVVVWVDDGLSPAGTAALEKKLTGHENIASVVYVSKTDALRELEETMGSAYLTGFQEYEDDNPLPASFRIQVKSLDRLADTERDLIRLAGVDSVESPSEVANTLSGIRTAISVSSTVIVSILMAVSVIIIANTVRVTIFNRRREIEIMKYVGATNAFIRFPFLVEGMVIGLFSAILSFALIWVGTDGIYQWLARSPSGWLQLSCQHLIPFKAVAGRLLLGLGGAGILFGALGSLVFVGKYLKV